MNQQLATITAKRFYGWSGPLYWWAPSSELWQFIFFDNLFYLLSQTKYIVKPLKIRYKIIHLSYLILSAKLSIYQHIIKFPNLYLIITLRIYLVTVFPSAACLFYSSRLQYHVIYGSTHNMTFSILIGWNQTPYVNRPIRIDNFLDKP